MTLEDLTKRVQALESIVESLRPVDLSDKYADFTVRKTPPKWLESGGADMTGYTISQTSPEFCDAIASFLDWQAKCDEEKSYSYVNGKGVTVFPAVYARKDAARARAWAQRLRETRPSPGVRAGVAPARTPARAPVQSDLGSYANGSDDEIPF